MMKENSFCFSDISFLTKQEAGASALNVCHLCYINKMKFQLWAVVKGAKGLISPSEFKCLFTLIVGSQNSI